MTSNQIAYAQVLENKRHNEAYEGETKRHNEETEKLQSQKNAIDAEAVQVTATYNANKIAIEQDYNAWYKQYMSATTEKKLQLQQEGNYIESRKVDNELWYSQQKARLEGENNAILSARQKEDKRHNVALETINMIQAANDVWWTDKRNYLESEKNRYTETYYTGLIENAKRGQDLTFDASVLQALGRSSTALKLGPFSYSMQGLGLGMISTSLDILEKRYGTKIEEEGSGFKIYSGQGNQEIRKAEQGQGVDLINSKAAASEARRWQPARDR